MKLRRAAVSMITPDKTGFASEFGGPDLSPAMLTLQICERRRTRARSRPGRSGHGWRGFGSGKDETESAPANFLELCDERPEPLRQAGFGHDS